MNSAILKSKCYTMYCGWLAVLVGGSVLLGWVLDLEYVKSVLPGFIAMNPLTAVCFILAGTSLYIQREANCPSKKIRLARGCALTVLVVGLGRLSEYVFGLRLGWDQVLFAASLDGNTMAPNTAVSFVLCGLALLSLKRVTRRGHWPAQIPAGLLAMLALICLVGYGYGTSSMYRVGPYIPMALNTALVFQVLSVGILLSHPERGPASVLFHDGLGGMMLRRLLPFVIAVPCALGWLRLWGQRAGLYDTEFGAAFMVAITVVLFSLAACSIAATLNKTDGERRRAAAELARTNQEIRELYAELEMRVNQRTAELKEANADLLDKNQENEMFVYSVSHDLRSPLVNLQGFSQELGTVSGLIREFIVAAQMPATLKEKARQLVDDDMQRCIRFIQTSVSRLSAIIDALLRLSRAGRIEYEPQAVDVDQIVSRVIEAMSAISYDRGVEIKVDPLASTWGDPTAVEQIFANLVGNAVNYLDPQRPGQIHVGTLPSDDQSFVTYFVRDNGLGIAKAYHAKVFQALKRLHPKVAVGEGIGLALVKRIIERHGGSIWFDSAVDIGTTFYVKLPKPVFDAKQPTETDQPSNPADKFHASQPLGHPVS